VNWVEITSNGYSLGKIAFMSMSNFQCVIPFGGKVCEGFLNISCLEPDLD